MAAAYCSDTELLAWLPDSATLPAEFDTEAERLVYINKASYLVDAEVGPRFALQSTHQKFPDTTSSPATPSVIALITSRLAAWLILIAMQATNLTGADPKKLRDAADAELARIRSGMTHVVDSSGNEYGEQARISSNTQTTAATFTQGRYDEQGNLISDYSGTLDTLVT